MTVIYKQLKGTNIKLGKIVRYRNLTRSGLEWKRNSKIFVPTAPFGGSSKAVNAKVDSKTYRKCLNKNQDKDKKSHKSNFINFEKEIRMLQKKYYNNYKEWTTKRINQW